MAGFIRVGSSWVAVDEIAAVEPGGAGAMVTLKFSGVRVSVRTSPDSVIDLVRREGAAYGKHAAR